MDQQNHKTGIKYHINLLFALSTYKIVIEIDSNYQLDLRDSEFGDFKIGLDKKLLNKTEYGSRLPNIINSIGMIRINTDAITNSILNGVNTNTTCTCEHEVCIFCVNEWSKSKTQCPYVEKVFDLKSIFG